MRNFITEEMRERLGYDDYGNNPELVCEVDRVRIEKGDWTRVDGNALCACEVAYRYHPRVQGALWLHRTCTGLIVKL